MFRRLLVLLIAIVLLGGCRSKSEKAAPAAESAPVAGTPGNPAAQPIAAAYSEPPTFDVGLSVEQAYAAIPHRRTVWDENNSTAPAEEKTYLKVIFEVIDQGVAVRVAGQQNFSSQQFDRVNAASDYDQLITFARGMPVPGPLAAYHQKILTGLTGQQQFFADWMAEREQFKYAQQIANHLGVRSASAALRAAYNELMAKYPNESASNKDAFFDYHCALDFL
jgi:hypothetical protein